jgi:hypothetical protein
MVVPLYNSERRFLMYFPHVIVFFIYLFLLEKKILITYNFFNQYLMLS